MRDAQTDVAALVERLRARTKETLPTDWQKGRKCPECGSDATRPKCFFDMGSSCPRHDPDAYDPPAWTVIPDKDAHEIAATLESQARELAEARRERDELRAAFRPMDTWDKRDETVLLLVDYTDGDHPLADALIAMTIGHNNDHNVCEGEGSGWQFAGWCWTHDHYVQGKGKPIGWMPLPHYLIDQTEGSKP